MTRPSLLLCCLLLPFFATAQESTKAQENWKNEMQSMKTTLTALLPYAVSTERFNSSENAQVIDKYIDQLISNAKALGHHKGKFEGAKDPTIEFVAEAFENDLGAIKKSISRGRRDYARYLVLNTTAYCMECHTRTNTGPSFVGLESNEAILKLNPVERVEYLISVRQFQEALKIIEETLKQDRNLEFFGNEKLLRYGMTTTIKYFRNLDAALKIVESASSLKTIPFFEKNNFKIWKTSLLELKKEKVPKDIVGKIEKAQKWIGKGEVLNMKAQSSHAGDVYLLQANATLLELFKEPLTEKQTPQILFLIGETYRMLPEHIVWTLHESYYEACIHKAPRSEQARQCYNTLEESILMGYTGSSGTHIPLDIVEKLKKLKKLSTPLTGDIRGGKN